jgi:hypothetical protein
MLRTLASTTIWLIALIGLMALVSLLLKSNR